MFPKRGLFLTSHWAEYFQLWFVFSFLSLTTSIKFNMLQTPVLSGFVGVLPDEVLQSLRSLRSLGEPASLFFYFSFTCHPTNEHILGILGFFFCFTHIAISFYPFISFFYFSSRTWFSFLMFVRNHSYSI